MRSACASVCADLHFYNEFGVVPQVRVWLRNTYTHSHVWYGIKTQCFMVVHTITVGVAM